MTIYVDDPRTINEQFTDWCHMWTDGDIDELHFFAVVKLGLDKRWVQHSKGKFGDFWHYDISFHKRKIALDCGAVYMPLREWVKNQIGKI